MHLALPQAARRVAAIDEVTVTGEEVNGRTDEVIATTEVMTLSPEAVTATGA
jgi:hypothetical protein